MHFLIAPNAFKNALTAEEAADCIYEGLLASRLICTSTLFPIGDGGDGTGMLLIKRTAAKQVHAPVRDASGRTIDASFGITDDHIAIIELADVCGLKRLAPDQRDPMRLSTEGVGELIIKALDKKAKKILLCIGGSSTVDGGTGILHALGMRFLDVNGQPFRPMPQQLCQLYAMDGSGLDQRIFEVPLVILCDVSNPLLGPQGSAIVFGPQKGAGTREISCLEAGLKRLRDVALAQTGRDMGALPYGGAAGGVAAGLAVLLHAYLVKGIDYFLDFTDFDLALSQADFVITGEGKMDEQTLQGKGPFGVATRAGKLNKPVAALAGQVTASALPRLQQYFGLLQSITPPGEPIEAAINNTRTYLINSAQELGNSLASRQ